MSTRSSGIRSGKARWSPRPPRLTWLELLHLDDPEERQRARRGVLRAQDLLLPVRAFLAADRVVLRVLRRPVDDAGRDVDRDPDAANEVTDEKPRGAGRQPDENIGVVRQALVGLATQHVFVRGVGGNRGRSL